MKLNVLACCLSLLGTAAFAQKNEWRDPNVNEINRRRRKQCIERM